MENSNFVNAFLLSVNQFKETNLKLVKLKAVDKTADIISTLVSRILLVIILLIILITLTITASLWLGELLGKLYYGFIVVSVVYIIIAAILHFFHRRIKTRVADLVVMQILKKD